MTHSEQFDAAITLRDEGKLDEAITALEALKEEVPDYVLAYQALAVLYQRVGRNAEAMASAHKVVELAPEDPLSQVQLSVIAQRCGQIEVAETALARGGGRPQP